MNKIDAQIRMETLTSFPAVAADQVPATPRLVVIVSEVADEALLASQILSLAQARHVKILILGVSENLALEIELQRKLITLAAFIRGSGARVQVQMERGRNWMQSLRSTIRSEDLVACCVEDPAGAFRVPLSDILASQLALPVYVFSAPERSGTRRPGLAARLAPWLGSAAIILGFLWLQIRLALVGDSAGSSAWLLLSVAAEVALIWGWNSITG